MDKEVLSIKGIVWSTVAEHMDGGAHVAMRWA